MEMKRRCWFLAVGAALVLLLAPAFWGLLQSNLPPSKLESSLLQADHQKILAECRMLMREGGERFIKPDDASWKTMPPAIKALRPRHVQVLPERVWLYFAEGAWDLGFYAFPEDEPGYGDREVVDGLWYYRTHR